MAKGYLYIFNKLCQTYSHNRFYFEFCGVAIIGNDPQEESAKFGHT
jgi:hypothetical protein